jgi:hypothetical protein
LSQGDPEGHSQSSDKQALENVLVCYKHSRTFMDKIESVSARFVSGECKGNLTTLRRILLHLDLAKGNPK